jgi:PadR family transcriptional regulator, regulatory protein PadR
MARAEPTRKKATAKRPAAAHAARGKAAKGDATSGAPTRTGSEAGWSPRDLLVPYVLLAISAQKAHGYYIEQYLRGLGLAQVEMSRIYRTLRQLEAQGLVTSAWEAGPGGPARRVYTLTGPGRTWLQSGAAMLEGYRTAIDAFFGRYRPDATGKKERDQ